MNKSKIAKIPYYMECEFEPIDWVDVYIKEHSISCKKILKEITTEDPAKLSEKEKCAIAWFAGVPFKYENGLIKFAPFGVYRRDKKWDCLTDGKI